MLIVSEVPGTSVRALPVQSSLCLFTNSESNVRFYQRCGFRVVDERQFTYNNQTIGSWSLARKV